ncbi:MAG TPA: ATP-binding protein [Terriglobales bacterium]|nr:ATP-binding protein [Terriglobales bacterium]
MESLLVDWFWGNLLNEGGGLSSLTAMVFGGLFVVERRGRSEKLDPKRHVEISTLLEGMPEAVFLFDTDCRVVDTNAQAEQLTGCSRHELRGMTDHVLVSKLSATDEHGNGVSEVTSALRRAVKGDVVRHARRSLRDPRDGRELEALVSASPMRNRASGEIVGALVMVRDVTEVSQLQRRLADTQRHNAIGQMAAGIAHDFNNVLDAINQAVFLLEMNVDKPADERKVYTSLIKKSVRRGAEISERVREYLRTGTGVQEEVDLRSLMDDVVEMTRPMWQVARKIHVRTQFGPVRKVLANAADMRRVFTNLIINALEAMPNGGVLTLGCEELNGKVRVLVEDTGQGIAPDQEKKIFVPYFTTKKTGTGLGLSGAHKIVTAAGGDIRFSSKVGTGTAFIIELPIIERRNERREGESASDTVPEDAAEETGEPLARVA